MGFPTAARRLPRSASRNRPSPIRSYLQQSVGQGLDGKGRNRQGTHLHVVYGTFLTTFLGTQTSTCSHAVLGTQTQTFFVVVQGTCLQTV